MDIGVKATPKSSRCSYCESQRSVMKRCVRCRCALYCSLECQIKDWKTHQKLCSNFVENGHTKESELCKNEAAPEASLSEEKNSSPKETLITSRLTICVKCNHKKHKITLNNVESEDGTNLMEILSKQLKIPILLLRLIGKGKLVTDSNIKDLLLKQKISVFQAFGEEAEDEDDLDAEDIDAIMDELHVTRNKAIRSLRACNGDLIDAIIELGNKI